MTTKSADRQCQKKLLRFLMKLNVKSAFVKYLSISLESGSIPYFESLEATLSSVTFDDKDLKLWPKIKP